MSSNHFIVNVEAAIYKENSWLMIVRSKKESHAGGMLSMVGGTVDYADASLETLESALRREVEEEVGVTLSDTVTYLESKTFVSQKGNHVLDIVFLCKYKSGEPTPKSVNEVESVSWMTIEEIMAHSASPVWIQESMKKAEATRSLHKFKYRSILHIWSNLNPGTQRKINRS